MRICTDKIGIYFLTQNLWSFWVSSRSPPNLPVPPLSAPNAVPDTTQLSWCWVHVRKDRFCSMDLKCERYCEVLHLIIEHFKLPDPCPKSNVFWLNSFHQRLLNERMTCAFTETWNCFILKPHSSFSSVCSVEGHVRTVIDLPARSPYLGLMLVVHVSIVSSETLSTWKTTNPYHVENAAWPVSRECFHLPGDDVKLSVWLFLQRLSCWIISAKTKLTGSDSLFCLQQHWFTEEEFNLNLEGKNPLLTHV